MQVWMFSFDNIKPTMLYVGLHNYVALAHGNKPYFTLKSDMFNCE